MDLLGSTFRKLAKLVPTNTTKTTSSPQKIPVDKRIDNMLRAAEFYCLIATQKHFRLFKQTTSNLIEGGEANINEIEEIVSGVTNSILTDCTKIGEITHISISGIKAKQVETLNLGLNKLERLQPEAPSVEETRRQSETRKRAQEDAIKHDDHFFKKTTKFLNSASRAQNSGDILLYNMENPNGGYKTVTANTFSIPTCFAIRNHLRAVLQVANPDVWIRHIYKHNFARTGTYWELLPATSKEELGGKSLDYISRKSTREYIVALKYVPADMEEVPVSLELVALGDRCCENERHDLQQHLNNIWPNHHVVTASRIIDNDPPGTGKRLGDCLMRSNFDNNLFTTKTNELFIKLAPN